jgi:uncharacterized membrane protein (UPF0127 family)
MKVAKRYPKWIHCVLALAVLILAGCAGRQRTVATSCTPVLELGTKDTLVMGGHSLQVAVLKSSSQRKNGLLKACALTQTEGALFVMPSAQDWAFHTQGMTQPIEIAFLDADRRLIAWHDAPPGLLDIRGGKPASYVLEVAPGTMARLAPAGSTRLEAFLIDTVPQKACELVRSAAWACPLTPGGDAPQVTAQISGFSDWRGEKTECALKLSLCVMASADFEREMHARTFQDATPASTGSKEEWAGVAQTTQRPWPGQEAYAVLVRESKQAARHFTVTPVGFWWEVYERLPFTSSQALTPLHSSPVRLFRRWVDRASVPALATTLMHEWIHVAYFVDPVQVGDSNSVVYGSEPFVEMLARRAFEEFLMAATSPAVTP